MNKAFNAAVLHIAGRLHPRGWTVGPEGQNFGLDGRPMIPDDLPLGQFGDQGVAEAFEAWRLWAHQRWGLPFDTVGEIQAACVMAGHVVELYGASENVVEFVARIFAEVVGQSLYHKVNGEFPALPAVFVDRSIGRYTGPARRFVRLAYQFSDKDTLNYGLAWAARELVSEPELEAVV